MTHATYFWFQGRFFTGPGTERAAETI